MSQARIIVIEKDTKRKKLETNVVVILFNWVLFKFLFIYF